MFGLMTATVLCLAPAPAVDKGPDSPSPQLQFVSMNRAGELVVNYFVFETISVLEKRLVDVNGKATEAVFQVQKTIPIQKKSTRSTKGMKATTVDGKEVDLADLSKLLKNGAAVIMSTEGEKIDPAYLKIFKDGTLILKMPKETAIAPQ